MNTLECELENALQKLIELTDATEGFKGENANANAGTSRHHRKAAWLKECDQESSTGPIDAELLRSWASHFVATGSQPLSTNEDHTEVQTEQLIERFGQTCLATALSMEEPHNRFLQDQSEVRLNRLNTDLNHNLQLVRGVQRAHSQRMSDDAFQRRRS